MLAAYFASADVFVCASDHEGFCVPLVEAMAGGSPVVAYDAAAVGETVGGAGLARLGQVAAGVRCHRPPGHERSGALAAGWSRREATEPPSSRLPASGKQVRCRHR